jgi:hypothetical protein
VCCAQVVQASAQVTPKASYRIIRFFSSNEKLRIEMFVAFVMPCALGRPAMLTH